MTAITTDVRTTMIPDAKELWKLLLTCLASVTVCGQWVDFDNQPNITLSVCYGNDVMITCEASHVIWVNNVRVGRISNSTGDADPLQCATPEESCEVLADDIRKCNSYQTCGITQIAADSAECLHGGFVYDTNFMEITHTCIEVNNLQVVDICSVVEMTLTSAMLVSPSWHDDVEQPVHCQCHILVQENTPLEVTIFYVHLSDESDSFTWKAQDSNVFHISSQSGAFVSEQNASSYVVDDTTLEYRASGVTGRQDGKLGSKLWLGMKGDTSFQLSCNPYDTSGAFGWLTDQIEEFAIPGVVALVVMLLAVVGLVTCGKRRKKKAREGRSKHTETTTPNDQVYQDIPDLRLNDNTLPMDRADIPPSPPRTPRPSPSGSPTSTPRSSAVPPHCLPPTCDDFMTQDVYTYARGHQEHMPAPRHDFYIDTTSNGRSSQPPPEISTNSVSNDESPQRPMETYLDPVSVSRGVDNTRVLPRSASNYDNAITRTGSVRGNAYVRGAILRNEPDTSTGTTDDGYMAPRNLRM